MRGTIIAKWSLEGITTLEDTAQKLEAYAVRLRQLNQIGWELDAPVEDDHGYTLAKKSLEGENFLGIILTKQVRLVLKKRLTKNVQT